MEQETGQMRHILSETFGWWILHGLVDYFVQKLESTLLGYAGWPTGYIKRELEAGLCPGGDKVPILGNTKTLCNNSSNWAVFCFARIGSTELH